MYFWNCSGGKNRYSISGTERECDFLIKEKDSQKISAAIQVSIYFGSPAVREREILGLMEALDEYGLEEGLILTMDDEEVLRD